MKKFRTRIGYAFDRANRTVVEAVRQEPPGYNQVIDTFSAIMLYPLSVTLAWCNSFECLKFDNDAKRYKLNL
jgi:hypothetical protein